MTWQPIVLFAFAGLLFGGVLSTWKNSKIFAGILALLTLGLAVGGVLWVLSE